VKITSTRFVRAAACAADEPKTPGAGVVFLGRSNVGKSSLINKLLGTKGLARTSSSPGRTQTVNFYRVNEVFDFIDLPGYGFAKVPERIRKLWGPMIESFLERHRERISLAVLLIDARHEPTRLDGVMQDWLVEREIPFILAVTKCDKLSGNGRTKTMRGVKKFARSEAVLTSSTNGTGIKEIWRNVDRALVA